MTPPDLGDPVGREVIRTPHLLVSVAIVALAASTVVWVISIGYWYWVPVAIYWGVISGVVITAVVMASSLLGLRFLPISSVLVRIFFATLPAWIVCSIGLSIASRVISGSTIEIVVAGASGAIPAAASALLSKRWGRARVNSLNRYGVQRQSPKERPAERKGDV
jgi:hypothetical protein